MRVIVGRIGRAHGIRGDVAIEPRTDEPDKRFAVGSSVLCRHGLLTISSFREHSGRFLAHFEEIVDRTAAESHSGCLLEVEIDPGVEPDDDDSYYDHQLRGLRVMVDGQVRGTVTDVLHLPAQDSLLLDLDGREAQVPFVEALVTEVDLLEGTVTIADRPGLLDQDAADEVR